MRGAARVMAGYTLAYFAVFSPVLLAGNLLAPGDGVIVFLAGFRSARWDWDPTMFAGFPGLADPQRMSWYPPSLAADMLPDGWNALVVSGYVLASCFTYAYVRSLTGSSLGAAVAGLAYGLSGFLIAHLGHVNLVHASAWLPLLFLSLEKLRQRATPARISLAALAFACSVLAGHPQITAYSLLYLAPYALAAALRAPTGRVHYLTAAAAAGLVGLALSAILLLPLAQLAKGSMRSEMDYATFTSFNLPLRQLPQLLFPYAYGGSGQIAYVGAGNITETTGYVGLLPLVLAVAGAWLARDQRVVRYWLAAGACALLFALGADGGLAALAYYVPIFNKFRCPARHLGELALAVSVLAGWGVAGLSAAAWRTRIQTATMASMAAVILLAGAAATLFCQGRILPVSDQAAAWRMTIFPLAALAIGLPVFWLHLLKPMKWSGGLLLAAVALELGSMAQWADWRWQYVEKPVLACPPVLAKYRDEFSASGQRLTGLLSSPHTPLDAALPNLPALWNLPTTGGYHPLAPQRMAELLHIHPSGNGLESFDILTDENRALDLLASRYVLAPNNLIETTSALYSAEAARLLNAPSRFRRAEVLQGSVSFENTRAMPRAWLVNEVRQLDQGQVLRAVSTSRLSEAAPFDPATTALVEEACDVRSSPKAAQGTLATQVLGPGDVRIEAETQNESFCVASDIFYPGWRARIDGQPTKLFRVDYVLMGVKLPAGRHIVQFEYIPTRFHLGAAITICALLAALLALAWPSVARKFFGRHQAAQHGKAHGVVGTRLLSQRHGEDHDP